MPTNLRYQEYGDALLIRATKQQGIVNAIVSAVVSGGFAAIIIAVVAGTWRVLSAPGFVMALLAAAVVGFAAGTFPSTVELRVTNLEFASRKFGVWGIRHANSISRADVRWLEYQEDASGPESDHPDGLYAVLKRRSVCILPHVTAEQTEELIERITTKFPDFRNQWRNESAFGSHFISLRTKEPDAGA